MKNAGPSPMRGAKSPSKANVSPSRASPVRPSFVQSSAPHDFIDPIYENNDPIAVSIKSRVAEGSFMSVVKAKKE